VRFGRFRAGVETLSGHLFVFFFYRVSPVMFDMLPTSSRS